MYLDPGFGGMLVQIIIAIIAAGGATMFALRKKMKAAFSRNKESEQVQPEKVNADSDTGMIDMLSDDN